MVLERHVVWGNWDMGQMTYSHISPYRKDLGWLSVKYRRMYFMTCLLYKLLSVGKPNYLRNLFVEEADVRRSDRLATKKHTSFELPRFTTTYLEHSFLVTDKSIGKIA
ncbi:uncharacterized protein LOC141537263 [Cotesia typhae]|uniref:uncharacterized protein LOC141537263 n=1 Tax=Cotesia typhae TaxID=2053667 RepID=UPI003D698D5A